jgi:phenylalanyl-tRNA synthetase alpha chain
MKKDLEQLKKEFISDLDEIKSADDLETLENSYLGRKSGKLTDVLKGLKDIPKKDIAEVGKLANITKVFIADEINKKKGSLGGQTTEDTSFDITLPGSPQAVGHLHPATKAIREISTIFKQIGFKRVWAPDVEWDYYAFESLNMPKDHPARDEWETFFIDKTPIDKKFGKRVLTPHTSSAQVREMERGRLPIRIMNISKSYRRQIDASHTPMFHQFEGLIVDEGINITHLKGTIDYFVKSFFGADREIRLRPHHFQFTEPSFEVDISCGVCLGKGCKFCKGGWVELAGTGMIHPNVLKAGNIDPKKYSGFAFGWGVERCYSMKADLNVDDIRLPYKNDLRFLKQF